MLPADVVPSATQANSAAQQFTSQQLKPAAKKVADTADSSAKEFRSRAEDAANYVDEQGEKQNNVKGWDLGTFWDIETSWELGRNKVHYLQCTLLLLVCARYSSKWQLPGDSEALQPSHLKCRQRHGGEGCRGAPQATCTAGVHFLLASFSGFLFGVPVDRPHCSVLSWLSASTVFMQPAYQYDAVPFNVQVADEAEPRTKEATQRYLRDPAKQAAEQVWKLGGSLKGVSILRCNSSEDGDIDVMVDALISLVLTQCALASNTGCADSGKDHEGAAAAGSAAGSGQAE